MKKESVSTPYYIHKQSGRIKKFPKRILEILGDRLFKEWSLMAETPDEVASFHKVEKVEVEDVSVREDEPVKLTVREITSSIEHATDIDLQEFLKDERVTVRKAAEAEIERRKDGSIEE